MGRSRRCCTEGCTKFAKHSVDGVYLYCITHMRLAGLIPKESPKKRKRAVIVTSDATLHGDTVGFAAQRPPSRLSRRRCSSQEYEDEETEEDVYYDGEEPSGDDCGSRNQNDVEEEDVEEEDGTLGRLDVALLDVVHTLCNMESKVAEEEMAKALLAAAGSTGNNSSAEVGEKQQDAPPADQQVVKSEQQAPPSLPQAEMAQVPPKPKLIKHRRYPTVYDDDATPIVRRGSHKGRVCAHEGCEKFARLAVNGIRKYCIIHMRIHGLVPKDYAKKQEEQAAAAAAAEHASTSSTSTEDVEAGTQSYPATANNAARSSKPQRPAPASKAAAPPAAAAPLAAPPAAAPPAAPPPAPAPPAPAPLPAAPPAAAPPAGPPPAAATSAHLASVTGRMFPPVKRGPAVVVKQHGRQDEELPVVSASSRPPKGPIVIPSHSFALPSMLGTAQLHEAIPYEHMRHQQYKQQLMIMRPAPVESYGSHAVLTSEGMPYIDSLVSTTMLPQLLLQHPLPQPTAHVMTSMGAQPVLLPPHMAAAHAPEFGHHMMLFPVVLNPGSQPHSLVQLGYNFANGPIMLQQ